MSKTAVAIRHVGFEDLGGFAAPLEDAGYRVRYMDVGVDEALDRVETDLLIILGGPVGVYEDAIYPFLRDELTLIETRLAADLPTMGICLGAQLVARAAGARVYPGAVKEIGFKPITLSDAGRSSCLSPFDQDGMTLHWHGDTFDLPHGAVRLASSDDYQNQAFSMGANIIGFQFHPEAGSKGFERWLIGHAAELGAAGVDVPTLRAEARRYGPGLEQKARATIERWLADLTGPPHGTTNTG